MKAAKEHIAFIESALLNQLKPINCTMQAICLISDCWVLLDREFNSLVHTKPTGYANTREWKLGTLHDSHIETAFKFILKGYGKHI